MPAGDERQGSHGQAVGQPADLGRPGGQTCQAAQASSSSRAAKANPSKSGGQGNPMLEPRAPWSREARVGTRKTANLRIKILDFRGFDPSRILILRGGILMSIGNFPDSCNLSREMLSGEMLSREIGRTRLPAYLHACVPACRQTFTPGCTAASAAMPCAQPRRQKKN